MVRKVLYSMVFLGGICAGLAAVIPSEQAKAAKAEDPAIVHDVYFSLKESTPENRQKLLDACKKYLTKHEGATHFAVGVVSDSLKGQFNDRDWDVGLHITFKNKAAHDDYSKSERHMEFVGQVREWMKSVRVFDTESAH